MIATEYLMHQDGSNKSAPTFIHKPIQFSRQAQRAVRIKFMEQPVQWSIYSATTFLEKYRKVVQEKWFEKSGSRNLVQEKLFYKLRFFSG